MRRLVLTLFIAMLVCTAAPFAAGNATLTSDPLTGLPLIPATDSRLHLGNEPTVMKELTVCKSQYKSNFYSVFDTKVDATLAWYAARLRGFRKTHAYAGKRSRDTFYKPDGTMAVAISGEIGAEGENTDTYSVVYALVAPGLPEKSIIGLNEQRFVCQ
jgi:hypothetical protein